MSPMLQSVVVKLILFFFGAVDCHDHGGTSPTTASAPPKLVPLPVFPRPPDPRASWPRKSPRPDWSIGNIRGDRSQSKSSDSHEKELPRQYLFGVTYYPWRKRKECNDVSEGDVRQDFRFLSSVAKNIQIFELYCNFTPIILKLVSEENMGILMGINVTNEAEYQRQKAVLEMLLPNSSITNIIAITVGRTSLFATIKKELMFRKLREITSLVRKWRSEVPVTVIMDSEKYSDMIPNGPEKVISAYPGFSDPNRSTLHDFVHFYNSWFDDLKGKDGGKYKKGTIFTEFGFQFDIMPNYSGPFPIPEGHGRPLVEAPAEIIIERLSCFQNSPRPSPWRVSVAEQEPFGRHGPPKLSEVGYFYHSAFDTPFEYGRDDPRAHWGLADADTREMKPILAVDIRRRASQGGLPNFGMCMDMVHGFVDRQDDDRRKESELNKQWIAIGASLSLATVAVATLIIVLCCRHRSKKIEARKRKMQLQASSENSNAYIRTLATYLHRNTDGYVDLISKSDYENLSALVGPEWLVDETAIHFEEIIGEGHFGIVQRGTLTRLGETVDVAVKRLHVGANNVRKFLSEGLLMEQFHHPNILPLVGISFTSYYLPMIITPFMEKGDLLSFVKNGENRLTVRQLLKFGMEIAEGMRYMHSLKLIHRDLAARNCMLDDSLSVKIADFGLCRAISESEAYKTARASDIPIRWMPPETIEKLEWTNKSDVWSYGIVLWELFTRGKQPYTRVPLIELRSFLRNGGRLQKPDGCPDIIYDLMKNCWHGQAEQRPGFFHLCETIPALVQALEGEQILDSPDYYNALTVMEMSQQPVSSDSVQQNLGSVSIKDTLRNPDAANVNQ